ncbi:hypothetical protein PHJA_000203500 [Phtheirospermum japonicum]|uniref:Uncharacterized protein n=1 Tax=Phtheirospermum japonicum TaxID=374723 RepID=A0A830B4Q6_9LAMI|nr:hypothetical protein PHJA_000203500 [Phtheirospermum japonicum]
MRFKSWTLYGDWCDIFGKDRATGENAQGFADAVDEIPRHPDATNGVDYDVPSRFEPGSPTVECENRSRRPAESSSTGRKGKRKKRITDEPLTERVCQMIEALCEKTDTRLGDLAQRIGYEQDAKKQRTRVFDSMASMNFLTVEQKIAVSKKLCTNNDDADLFFSLDEDNKSVMVRMLLEGRL